MRTTTTSFLALFSALLAISGCSPKPNPSRLIVALDRSDSTVDHRAEMLTRLDDLAGDADSARATLDIWAYDTTALRVWGPNPSTGRKALTPIKTQHFSPDPKHPRRGTRPGVLLQNLATDRMTLALSSEQPLRIVLLTDGGIDHADDPALLRKAAQTLKQQHPNLTLLVIGIDAQERNTWDRVVGEELPGFKAVTWSVADIELRRLNLGGK
jgi:hypothetical protein